MKQTSWFRRVFPSRPSTSRRGRAFPHGHQPAWVELLENRVMLSAQNLVSASLGALPGTSLDDVAVHFDLTQKPAAIAEMGVFQFDADGTVGGLKPGSDGFADAVLNSSSRQILFNQASPTGSSANLSFLGGSQVGVYFCPNPAAGNFTGGLNSQMTSANTFRLGFEQTGPIWAAVGHVPGAETREFDDAVTQVSIGNAVRLSTSHSERDCGSKHPGTATVPTSNLGPKPRRPGE